VGKLFSIFGMLTTGIRHCLEMRVWLKVNFDVIAADIA